jgi:erythromycin esterase-like protein
VKVHMSESTREETEAKGAMLWKSGTDVEALLRLMREKGFNQPESIETLVKITGMDLGMAQSAVLESDTWLDQHARNIRIQDELAQALLDLSQENNSNFKLTVEPDPDGSEPSSS